MTISHLWTLDFPIVIIMKLINQSASYCASVIKHSIKFHVLKINTNGRSCLISNLPQKECFFL